MIGTIDKKYRYVLVKITDCHWIPLSKQLTSYESNSFIDFEHQVHLIECYVRENNVNCVLTFFIFSLKLTNGFDSFIFVRPTVFCVPTYNVSAKEFFFYINSTRLSCVRQLHQKGDGECVLYKHLYFLWIRFDALQSDSFIVLRYTIDMCIKMFRFLFAQKHTI